MRGRRWLQDSRLVDEDEIRLVTIIESCRSERRRRIERRGDRAGSRSRLLSGDMVTSAVGLPAFLVDILDDESGQARIMTGAIHSASRRAVVVGGEDGAPRRARAGSRAGRRRASCLRRSRAGFRSAVQGTPAVAGSNGRMFSNQAASPRQRRLGRGGDSMGSVECPVQPRARDLSSASEAGRSIA